LEVDIPGMFKNLKIRTKLLIGLVSIGLMIVVTSFISVLMSQSALRDAIGTEAVSLVVNTMEQIDRELTIRTEELRAYAEDVSLSENARVASNKFDETLNIEENIKIIDSDWKAGKNTPTINAILNNDLSKKLAQHTTFLEELYEYPIIAEMYVTNKYGVIIGSTGRTSDYLQADETWYQQATKENEFWLGAVEYDESSDTFAIDIVVNLYDQDDKFVGILKGVLNVEAVKDIIDTMQARSQFSSLSPLLIDKKGFVIFSGLSSGQRQQGRDVELEEFGEDISSRAAVKIAFKEGDGFTITKDTGKELLSAFSISRDFKEQGWTLLIDFETNEIFNAIITLRNTLLAITLLTFIGALFVGLFISRYITRSVENARNAAVEIARGNMDVKIDTSGKDEIAELSQAVDQMRQSLKVVMEEYERKLK